MALNLSTLTSPATSGDVLAEALTTADFLEPVPVLRNLSRGSNKGGDAKQDVALNQPKALPLIDGDGYLYCSGVTGNYCEIPHDSSLAEMREVTVIFNAQTPDSSAARYLFARPSASSFQNALVVEVSGGNRVSFYDQGGSRVVTATITFGNVYTVKLTFNGTAVELFLDGVSVDTGTASSSNPFDISQNVLIGGGNTNRYLTGFVKSAVAKNASGTTVLNFDINATTVRHGDTKFKCATGQVVTINQAGNDPATIIKKPVLRFDGTDDGLRGVFNQTITDGYMFAAFSVLGTGGGNDSRVFSVNATGGLDYDPSGFVYGLKYGGNNDLAAYGASAYLWAHNDMYDDARGDILYETKAKSGGLITKVNNANKFQPTTTLATASNEFNVGNSTASVARAAAIDLEFLALFPAESVPDEATATQIRNYINNRNNVFDLKDGFGYYFFDAQKAPAVPITTGSASWNGRIVGSDFGDTDRYLTQGTSNDAPVGSGYTVTFADNTDHLDIPSTTQAGWQIVGTSLGTFAYRVQGAVSELNLLGNLGNASYRKAGDLYGVILLPDSATGADIEAARKLLIDRGAADGTTGGNYYAAWLHRTDIVEFKSFDASTMTVLSYAFAGQTNRVSFPSISFPNGTVFDYAWDGCSVMATFGEIQAPNGNNFTGAWRGATALTSFPAGAKLGTSASSVNFSSAWQSSGLTSFPALDLSTGNNFSSAFQSSDLTSFPAGINMSNGTNFANTWRDTDIVEFPLLNLDKSSIFLGSWRFNNLMTTFPAGFFDTWNPGSMNNFVFNDTWAGCTALTAQSVENILVSIDASGQYATSNGASGSSAITDTGIDISYNTATGSLSAATNAAVTSLKAKGWSIIVNNVTL